VDPPDDADEDGVCVSAKEERLAETGSNEGFIARGIDRR